MLCRWSIKRQKIAKSVKIEGNSHPLTRFVRLHWFSVGILKMLKCTLIYFLFALLPSPMWTSQSAADHNFCYIETFVLSKKVRNRETDFLVISVSKVLLNIKSRVANASLISQAEVLKTIVSISRVDVIASTWEGLNWHCRTIFFGSCTASWKFLKFHCFRHFSQDFTRCYFSSFFVIFLKSRHNVPLCSHF